ncbi:M23 family metallopeptidase [Pikeienuella piscinae]|uniref:M23 family metallopeptidase n=1 Tax=Pikeienuella piscinae TaxID=2748098 RepID=A0A7L5BTZ6_9RHOB|nr:M23 family metallopeptidase [Pikeienuella piscinae]QIE54631.1 M23 family metallopeptidase [Pikeienuella piscinae]
MPMKYSVFRPALVFSSALLAAACASDRPEPAPVTYRTPVSPAPTSRPAPEPNAAPATAPSPAPSGQADARGVVYYEGYETIRARSDDTVDAMAARVGLTGSELAAYNGLSTQYTPRKGDELVLPAQPDRYRNGGASTAPVAAPLAAPGYTPSAPERPGVEVADASATGMRDTGAAPKGEGWSADLARAAIGDAPASGVSSEPLAPPSAASAPEPATAETVTASVEPPAPAPEAAPAASTGGAPGFSRPVDAAVSRPFSRAPGPNRNDGVDFATAAGDPVRAAGAGTVALISQSLGGLGTIILIRHDNDYLTVYGRVDGIAVAKGDRVAKGQIIARVADLAPPQSPSLHFEVRRGAESVDPAPYL